jgi:hypothetical protein
MTTWTCLPQTGARTTKVSVWTSVLPSRVASATAELSFETILNLELPKMGEVNRTPGSRPWGDGLTRAGRNIVRGGFNTTWT